MAKICIRCKREISNSQRNCLICGASQSYISYYFKTAIVFIILLTGVLAAGYRFENSPEKRAELNRLRALAMEVDNSQMKITQLEELVERTNNKLTTAEEKLVLSEENTSAGNKSAAEKNKKVAKITVRALKAEKRASWLSKENINLKTENKLLNDQLLALQAKPDENRKVTPSISDASENKTLEVEQQPTPQETTNSEN